ncbi:hypothetical protein FF38_01497 [Lucilia cuprina]|uniref:Uncharacterized protein n=1 Tax=Lucilia cuprina TaxID=7375 RepID=A0A0L0BSS2_LUCCU|nr:hypothetical protein FF38_01497 [Lucilia cuprina]
MDIKEKILNGQYTTLKKSGKSKVWDVYAGILNEEGTELENMIPKKTDVAVDVDGHTKKKLVSVVTECMEKMSN